MVHVFIFVYCVADPEPSVMAGFLLLVLPWIDEHRGRSAHVR